MTGTTVEQWLKKAAQDELSFFVLTQHAPDLKDIAAFHAQQAVEKWLKSLFILKGIEPRKTHNLIFLLDGLIEYFPDLDTAENYIEIKKLDQYAVEIQYQKGLEMMTKHLFPEIEKIEEAMLHFKNQVFTILNL